MHPHLSGQTDILYVRIEGQAGVGKTRLALEIFRPQDVGTPNENGFAERVMYAGRPTDIPQGLFQWLEVNTDAQLVLVVDECDQLEADKLLQQVQRCNGRVRLLAIGQAQEVRRIIYRPPEIFLLEQLSDEAMKGLLRTTAPYLPHEHVDYIVRLSSGFVKLATAIAAAVQRHPELAAARDLAGVYEVTQVLRQFLLPDADFRVMQAAALLIRVGWDEDLRQEGEVIVQFLNLDWNEAVVSLQRQFNEGLVSKQGRYRYVTPHLLAVWLAAEAWEAHGNRLLDLIPLLPTWNSCRALLERLRDLGDHPRAQQVVELLLGPEGIFRDVQSLNDEMRAEIFALLAETHPRAGVTALARLLSHLPRDELRRFYKGRRHIVWVLEKLAWLPETFFGAARVLLALAEAENERWGNNASGIWTGLFSTTFGGTAVPALERHQLIAEALESPSVERQLLALRAIRDALQVLESRSVGAEHQGGRLVPPEWHPRTPQEDQEVRLSALALLDRALASSHLSVHEEAEQVLLDTAWNVVTFGLADAIRARLECLPVKDDTQRRKVQNVVELILEEGDGYLGLEQRKRFELLRESLISQSFHDRLRRWVGEWTHADWRSSRQAGKRSPEEEAAALAEEAIQSPESFRSELDWLVSDEAKHIYHFARRLGERDTQCQWWSEIELHVHTGQGLALASAYLQGHVDAGRRDWRDTVLDRWITKGSGMAQAVLDAIWRGEPNDRDVQRLLTLVRQHFLPPEKLRILVWGGQTKPFSTGAFRALIDCMLCSSADEAVTAGTIELLEQRFDFYPDEIDILEQLAWQILERRNVPLQDSTVESHWDELAHRYLAKDPVRLACIVLSFFHKEQISFIKSDPIVRILAEATRRAPEEVWSKVATQLLAGGMTSFRLHLCLRGWYAREVGEKRLLEWAERYQPEGPRITAELTPVAVWSYKGWVGDFYPPNSRPSDFLRLYSQRLTAVEGNTTFYAVPDVETVARWVVETPPGFVFCPKLPRDLTHKNALRPSIPGALQFLKQMQGLGNRLGPIFAQLPPHYGPPLLDDLIAFLAAWPRSEAPLAVEVRHPDWFREPHGGVLTEVLEQLGVGRVLLDTRPIYDGPGDRQIQSERRKPKLPLQPSVTAPFSLVRFISHPCQKYNQPFLEEWVSLVDQWLCQGVRVYFFAHCPIEAQSPGMVRYFQQLLEQRGVPVPPLPWNSLHAGPTQLSLFC